MRTPSQSTVLLAAVLFLADLLAASAAAQTRTDFIPFQEQEPDLVLLRDGRVLTGHVRELNEQLAIDTPERVIVPRSQVSLILVNSQEFPAMYPPLLMTEDAVLLKDGSIQQGHVTIRKEPLFEEETIFVDAMRLQQRQVRLIKLKETAVVDQPPPGMPDKNQKVRPLGFWVGQFRAAVIQQTDPGPDERIPQVIRYNGRYSVVLREGHENEVLGTVLVEFPGMVRKIDKGNETDPPKALKTGGNLLDQFRPRTARDPDRPALFRQLNFCIEKWAFQVYVDDCDSFRVWEDSWIRSERPDMAWSEVLDKSEIALWNNYDLWGNLRYDFVGQECRPIVYYQLSIPPVFTDVKADGAHPSQDETNTTDDGSKWVLADNRFVFMPQFEPVDIHGSDDVMVLAESGATRIRGSRSTPLKFQSDHYIKNHAVMAWDLRWRPPGKVPELPSDDEFDLDTELDQLQAESGWLQEELQNFQESASDSNETGSPASSGGQSSHLPPEFDVTSQRLESLWSNRQELQIEQVNVQPAIDVGTAISKIEQPGEPGSPIPAGELLALHRRLTGVMRHAFPAEAEGKADQEEEQQERAAGLSVERIKWLSRLQTAQELVQRAVEHRLRFESNRIRSGSQIGEEGN